MKNVPLHALSWAFFVFLLFVCLFVLNKEKCDPNTTHSIIHRSTFVISSFCFSNSLSLSLSPSLSRPHLSSLLSRPHLSPRCDVRAPVWDSVCVQCGGIPCQPPAHHQPQLRLDRPSGGHRLRQLPVSGFMRMRMCVCVCVCVCVIIVVAVCARVVFSCV